MEDGTERTYVPLSKLEVMEDNCIVEVYVWIVLFDRDGLYLSVLCYCCEHALYLWL